MTRDSERKVPRTVRVFFEFYVPYYCSTVLHLARRRARSHLMHDEISLLLLLLYALS